MNISRLFEIAGGLNIEAGRPYHDLKRYQKDSLWVNLIVILDRPIVDSVLFSTILEKITQNNYPLLENAIDELNETHMLSIFLLTILYYIEEGKRLLNKENINIRIHVHQDKLSQNLIKILDNYLQLLLVKLSISTKDINISYQTDDYTYVSSSHEYNNIDILISLSQCAGLDPNHNPGKIYITQTFIPFDIKTNQIDLSNQYTVENDIFNQLENMVKKDYNQTIALYLNSDYQSANTNKQHLAKTICLNDFIPTTFLQVDDLWNPTDINSVVSIV
jgi:hypothetical protein